MVQPGLASLATARNRQKMTRRLGLFVVVSGGLLIAAAFGFFGLTDKFRMEAKNIPSTIGRSGDFKSPGGTTETSERRRM